MSDMQMIDRSLSFSKYERYQLKETASGHFIKAYSKWERKERMLRNSGTVEKMSEKGLRQDAPSFVPSESMAAVPSASGSNAGQMTYAMSAASSMAFPWTGFGYPAMNPMNSMMPMYMPKPFMGWQQTQSGKFQGRIKSYSSEKGFGFIQCAQTYAQFGRDVFLHKAQIGNTGVGTLVNFSCEVNQQGMPQAKEVVPLGGGKELTTPGGKKGKGKGDENANRNGGKQPRKGKAASPKMNAASPTGRASRSKKNT